MLDQSGQPAAGAIVYRIPSGKLRDGQPFTLPGGALSRTNAQGYLPGRGELGQGDQLVALRPITTTESYTLYHTSAAPAEFGLDAYRVAEPGVQTLTVSPAHPLVLLNLTVSLEWDARGDPSFLGQLRYDLGRSSELLYDWTDGQAALGNVTIYQGREHWDDAHIRVYATNRLRPNANQGGIVGVETTDPGRPQISYAPGQVRIGAVWNRYGEATGNLGEDWPRTLAHELGHYAFFLDDNYLGLDPSGRLTQVSGCLGAMSDPYLPGNSEFHPDAGWTNENECRSTLANHATHRSDWATIAALYARPELDFALHPPTTYNDNPGPSVLPLAVTQIVEAPPAAPADTISAPVLSVTNPSGGHIDLGKGARAILYRREGDRLVDLGSPVVDQVAARGARPDDVVCVYDLPLSQQGCARLTAASDGIPLYQRPNWQPDVTITPVTSTTLTVEVTNLDAGRMLQARIYPSDGDAPAPIALPQTTAGYSGTFQLAAPVLAGHIRVWDAQDDAEPAIVLDFALGGNPGYVRSRNAPAVSTDGQVILYADDLSFAPGAFYSVQATSVRAAPAWATPIGSAYRLAASASAPDLRGATIDIGYLSADVPPGEERWIKIYHWEDGARWRPLPTTLDQVHNEASTRVVGPGLYALMSSVEVGIEAPGWNNIAYPIPGERPVREALQSIDGAYTTVYGYEPSDTASPWRVYDVSAPPFVDTLEKLRFGHGYWIQATQAITLYLHGPEPQMAAALAATAGAYGPPATYYGLVGPAPGFVPAAGLPVIARINGVICGQGATQLFNGQIVYTVSVFGDGPDRAAGCGAAGRQVQFQVGDWAAPITAGWDNSRLHDLPLGALALAEPRVYVAFIRH